MDSATHLIRPVSYLVTLPFSSIIFNFDVLSILRSLIAVETRAIAGHSCLRTSIALLVSHSAGVAYQVQVEAPGTLPDAVTFLMSIAVRLTAKPTPTYFTNEALVLCHGLRSGA